MTIKKQWTNKVTQEMSEFQHSVCESFSDFPFMKHNHLLMQVNDAGRIECVTEMKSHLVGNVLYGILHGGVTATMLDSIGGIQTMCDLISHAADSSMSDKANPMDDEAIKNAQLETIMKTIEDKVSRVATTDFRVDYLTAGHGKHFIATAEVVRLGRRHSTCKMQLVNDEGKLIAIATGSYAY